MNESLARAAENGVHHGDFETEKGFCNRAARQFDAVVHGLKYDKLFRGDGTRRDATAARAAHRFLAAGLGFLASDLAKHGGFQPGDLGFKTQVAPNRWGDFSGHVGVLCMDRQRWAENSSTSKGRVRGALGFRTLDQFGDVDIIVRLPDPKARVVVSAASTIAPTLYLNDTLIKGAQKVNGTWFVPLRATAEVTQLHLQQAREDGKGGEFWRMWK